MRMFARDLQMAWGGSRLLTDRFSFFLFWRDFRIRDRLTWKVMDDSNYTILVVEDDENDLTLLKMAFKKNNILNPMQWARDGLEAVDYLNGKGIYADREVYPFPEVLILDLKMPRMNGLELLAWIRDHPDYRVIPTIIMSSSRQDL